MRFRSKKQEAIYRKRRSLVAQILEERPVCERCHRAASVDVHEVIRRSQWKAGILVYDNLRAVCRPCHTWINSNPQDATDSGWSDWSYNRHLYEWEGKPE